MKRTITITLVALIILIFTNIPSYALGFIVGVKPAQTTVSPGSTVDVTISVNNMNIGGDGMKVFSGILNYDTNIFEEITAKDITGLNSWEVSYNAKTKKILLDRKDFITEDAEICKITFKVKDGVETENTQIKITNPSTSNNRIDIDGTEGQATISLKKLSSGKYEITDDNEIKNVLPNTTVDDLKDNLTGGENTIIKDKDGNTISSGNIGTGSTVTTPSGDVYTVIVKGDLNGDGKVTLTDLAQLKLHMVETTLLQEPYKSSADIDGDGKVTLTDLGKLKRVLAELETL